MLLKRHVKQDVEKRKRNALEYALEWAREGLGGKDQSLSLHFSLHINGTWGKKKTISIYKINKCII